MFGARWAAALHSPLRQVKIAVLGGHSNNQTPLPLNPALSKGMGHRSPMNSSRLSKPLYARAFHGGDRMWLLLNRVGCVEPERRLEWHACGSRGGSSGFNFTS